MKKRKGLPYMIAADTSEIPGKITAYTVELNKIYIGQTDSVRVDLCDHPLYPKLERYVQLNPSRK